MINDEHGLGIYRSVPFISLKEFVVVLA